MSNTNAMYGAIARRDVEAVRRLVSEDPAILESHFLEDTWLHRAAMTGNTEIMRVLVDSGLPVDCHSINGKETPLDSAAGQGYYDACLWLLDHGADVNHGLGDAATPLYSAIFGRSLELVALFIDRGANLAATFGEPKIDVISYSQRYSTPEIVAFLRDRMSFYSSPDR